jgi:hypothetical protein
MRPLHKLGLGTANKHFTRMNGNYSAEDATGLNFTESKPR